MLKENQHSMMETQKNHPCEHKKQKRAGWLFAALGLSSLVWFLIRVLPKPDRAAYPCMKVAAPIASTFITYIVGITTTVFAFRKASERLKQSKYIIASLCVLCGILVSAYTFLHTEKPAYSFTNDLYSDEDPFGVNNPVGIARGVVPGRVVWAHDANATNEDCTPTTYGDGYFLPKNNNQEVIDGMLAGAMMKLTNAETQPAAWEAVFKYFNTSHDRGNRGYEQGENIYIKINSVHAGNMDGAGNINKKDYGYVDTSPQAVLALLRQLVYQAGVPQENIFIGDPFRKIFNHCYELWSEEFPNVHYTVRGSQTGRESLKASASIGITYSDYTTVLTKGTDRFYKQMQEADYLINVPAYKGHRWAGVSFFAKNNFGSSTSGDASHLHNGTILPDWNVEPRTGYGKYRVFVDLMGSKNLGGKTLLYLMDGLWATSYEHDPPCKFQMAPFNNDWCSSLFVSQDPVAIASVCLDMMRAEFAEADSNATPMRHIFVHYNGVDDYMHQAADPANWPEGVIYDPDDEGVPLTSLGVHEHWNNPVDMQYSRNLGTGDGIELVKSETIITSVGPVAGNAVPNVFALQQNYPNPFNPSTTIRFNLAKAADVELSVFNMQGQLISTIANGYYQAGTQAVIWNGQDVYGSQAASGVYIYRLWINTGHEQYFQDKKMTLVR